MNEDRKVSLVEVLVTEITEDAKFYGCTVTEGPALEKLMDSLREEFTTNPPLAGAYQPKKNDLCAAKFVDDQWYRAKVEKVGASDAQVGYFLNNKDYGFFSRTERCVDNRKCYSVMLSVNTFKMKTIKLEEVKQT